MGQGQYVIFRIGIQHPEIQFVESVQLLKGRFMNHFDMGDRRKVAVIGIKVEEILFEKEEDLRLALGAAHIGTWDWNIKTNDVLWSEGVSALFGMSEDIISNKMSCLGVDCHIRTHPEEAWREQ